MKATLPVRTTRLFTAARFVIVVAAVLLLVGVTFLVARAPSLSNQAAASGAANAAAAPAANSSSAGGSNASVAQAGSDKAATPAPPALTLNMDPKKAAVGDEIHVTGQGLPASANVELVWKTQQGSWVIEDYYHFKGKKFTDATQSLGKFTTGADGSLDARFAIPEDYGGVHDIVATVDGKPVAQGGVEVVQTFEMSPKEGPVGTVVEITAKGLGWRTMESTWVVNWDDVGAGWISAVTTKGTAVARFRATGAVGDHVVKVYSGYMAQSYLNFEQAPTAYLPRPDFTFKVTPGNAAVASYAEPYQPQPVPASESTIGAHLAINPTQGQVNTTANLKADGLPANSTLTLAWETWVGSRVSGNGFEPAVTELGQLKVGSDGKLDVPVTIPDDLGGLHGLVLKDGDKVLARTYFVVETSIVSISPTSGPVGTKVTIHLKGVGWTEYDNIYVANYDNAYMGYVCGFNSHGDVVMNFTVGGQPGIHLIDFYPGIYQGPGEGQQLYRLPQLTYAADHPGNKIPALRFAFEITK